MSTPALMSKTLLSAALLAFVLLSGCTLVHRQVFVRHKPVNLKQAVTDKPFLYLMILPPEYREFAVTFDLPGKKADLYFGEALVSAYREALSPFFVFVHDRKYADFTAVIPLGAFRFNASFSPSPPRPGGEVAADFSMAHRILIADRANRTVEDISVKREGRNTLSYDGTGRLLEMTSFYVEDMIAGMEEELYGRLEAAQKAGKFKPLY